MPDPAWPSSPPEANYLRLIGSGAAGTATTLASSAAWQALAAGNEIACATSALNTTATALDFEGVGGTRSSATATALNAALQLLAGWAQAKPPIAASAVAAYEAAVSAMIPAEVAAANRAEQAADVALNPLVLGALTPAIVALDTVYFGEFWPQNASAGAAYGATLTALIGALAVPPPLSPPGAAVTASATAAAAVAESAGQAAAGEALKESAQLVTSSGNGVAEPAAAVGQVGQVASMMSQPVQSAMGALQPAAGMFQSPLQALGSLPQSMMGALAGSLPGRGLGEAPLSAPIPGAVGLAAGGGGVGSMTAGAGALGAGGGAGALGPAGLPGGGLTSYSKPPTAFAAENAGRPTGLKPGLLGYTDFRGPTGSGVGGAALPMAPGHGQQSKGETTDDGVAHARIVLAVGEPADKSS